MNRAIFEPAQAGCFVVHVLRSPLGEPIDLAYETIIGWSLSHGDRHPVTWFGVREFHCWQVPDGRGLHCLAAPLANADALLEVHRVAWLAANQSNRDASAGSDSI